ncbi:MAG: hypothetical protein Q9M32_01775 [Sulfurimonas sp.]|nr:hypothetical protein [Sulfurimonas sp.]
MFTPYENKSLYAWVLFFMGVFSIAVDAFVFKNPQQSAFVWVALSAIAAYTLSEEYVQEIVDTFKSKEFSKVFNFYIKCYFVSFALTIFLLTAVTIFNFESSPDTPIGAIGFFLFIGISTTIYLLKRFNIYTLGICSEKENKQ